MRSNNNDYSSVWLVIMLAFCLGLLGQLFLGQLFQNKNTTAPASFDPTPAAQSDYQRVEQRFRREGYSDSDAQTAAQAVIKFHNAQQRK
jgi:hypothetical protein